MNCSKCDKKNLRKNGTSQFQARLSQILRKTGSENAHRCAKKARNGLGFDFLEPYHKYGDEFLNHIVRITGDETQVAFVNVDIKERSKQWMHTNSPNKPKTFKQTSACQKADGNCFLGQERRVDGGINAPRDHNNVRSVVRYKKTLCIAIRDKRHGILTSGELLPHDNMSPHTTTRTRALLEHFNWELFDPLLTALISL
jgi:hypothetical protein